MFKITELKKPVQKLVTEHTFYSNKRTVSNRYSGGGIMR